MSGGVEDVLEGLSSRLSTVAGLRVLTHPPASVSEFPAVVLLFESRAPAGTLGGSGFSGRIRGVLLTGPGDSVGAFRALGGFMDPRGTGSIEAAVEADSSWGGKVDYGGLASVGNVGRRKLWGGVYAAADFGFTFVKSS